MLSCLPQESEGAMPLIVTWKCHHFKVHAEECHCTFHFVSFRKMRKWAMLLGSQSRKGNGIMSGRIVPARKYYPLDLWAICHVWGPLGGHRPLCLFVWKNSSTNLSGIIWNSPRWPASFPWKIWKPLHFSLSDGFLCPALPQAWKFPV